MGIKTPAPESVTVRDYLESRIVRVEHDISGHKEDLGSIRKTLEDMKVELLLIRPTMQAHMADVKTQITQSKLSMLMWGTPLVIGAGSAVLTALRLFHKI